MVKARGPLFGDQLKRRLDQRLAQIAVMIAALAHEPLPLGGPLPCRCSIADRPRGAIDAPGLHRRARSA
jgi:hypothetical protein